MKFLILPGDGIGPEITAATCRVLESLSLKFDLGFDLVQRDIGFAAYDRCKSTMPDDVMEEISRTEMTILGPADTFAYPPKLEGGINPSKTVRSSLDLYANFRPSRTRKGVPALGKNMDLVLIRENTEGFYADRNMFLGEGEFMPTQEVALAVRKITKKGSARIAKSAFELARERRQKVTIVHKANVLKMTDGLFLSEARAVGEDYPDVEVEDVLVDAMAALLVRRPESFDVVLTSNMYGDILSDECAELSGGLGFGGSLNAGDEHAVAQAAHGSAPDIAGEDIANPTALMLSAQMLLEWAGRRRGDSQLVTAAKYIERGIDYALGQVETQTKDIGGPLGTRAFGEAVAGIITNMGE